MAIYHIGLIIPLWINRKKISFKKVFEFQSSPFLLISSLVCLSSGILLFYTWEFIKIPHIDLKVLLSTFGLEGLNFWVFLAYFSTINPFLEELFWRFMLKTKAKYIGVNDVLFAFYHFFVLIHFVKLEYAILAIITLMFASRFWRYLHCNTKESLAIILTHSIADFSLILSIILLAKN